MIIKGTFFRSDATGRCSAVGNVSDCRSRVHKFVPGPVPYFVEIDHEIISTAIFLPSADSRREAKVCARNTS